MIVHLHGTLAEKEPTRVVVECGGVGYEALIPLSTYDRLPATGAETTLLTAHVVREDDELLFGFATAGERELFRLVTTVSGVGPKLGLAVLSGMSAGDLQLAIAQGDAKRIASVKGVGKKTAEKIVIELKDKVNPIEALAASAHAASQEQSAVLRDAMLALTALGFTEDNARKAVQNALEEVPEAKSTEEILRLALKRE